MYTYERCVNTALSSAVVAFANFAVVPSPWHHDVHQNLEVDAQICAKETTMRQYCAGCCRTEIELKSNVCTIGALRLVKH